MDHTSQSFMIIMAVLAVLGVAGTVVYYFFRFGFHTDYDRDTERVKKQIPQDLEEQRSEDQKITGADQPVAEKEPVAVADSEAGAESPQAQSEPIPISAPEPTPAPVITSEPEKNINTALAKTRESFFSRLKSVFSENKLSDDDLESLEEVLYTSDLGPQTVQRLMEAIEENLSGDEKRNLEKVTGALKAEMARIFSELEEAESEAKTVEQVLGLPDSEGQGLQVWLVVGVNGAGKTTTIGKLANIVAKSGRKVMVAAGDTFRAAAGDQLKVWSERAQVEIFSPPDVKDPSAVAFDAVASAKAKDFDVVIVDTAGRLHTQSNLMQELEKMNRVMKKVIPEAPHETLLVLDANSGQNALIQAKQFNEVVELSGAVLTKLDGSAKGGVAVGLAYELQLPVRLIGVGEGIDDIRSFDSKQFVDSIL